MQPRELLSGRFEIQALAGSGGMGEVYRALDRRAGVPVAVKILHGRGGDHVERFAREARLLSELRHQGIVQFVATGTTENGEAYLAMEWLEGEGLSARLTRGPLSVSEALVVARRVAEALEVAHARGVVHRDLKPGNLFLVQGSLDRLKVLDFGIARLIEPGQALTLTGTMLGTPGYMSPEQARGEKDVDARSDLFALGCVLFRCLAGRPPYEGDSALSISLKVIGEPAPRVLDRRLDTPPAFDDLIARLLSRERRDRPPSAAALLVELAALSERAAIDTTAGPVALPLRGAPAQNVAVAATVVSRRAPLVHPPPKAPRRGSLHVPLLAAGLVVLAAAGLVGFFSLRRSGEIDPALCADLGLMYEHGRGGYPKDPERAAALYRKCCDAGNADACVYLGALVENGKGVPRDEAEAVLLYRKACDVGFSPGCNHLGRAYEAGRGGLARDDTKAVALYQKTCEAGNANGCLWLGAMSQQGRGGLAKDEGRAAAFYSDACDAGAPNGCVHLGLQYLQGLGVPRDRGRGMELLRRGCAAGSDWGCQQVRSNGAR